MTTYCELCNSQLTCHQHALPFNHLEDDIDFHVALVELRTNQRFNTDRLSNLILNPLIFNNQFPGNADVDPDSNFYFNTQTLIIYSVINFKKDSSTNLSKIPSLPFI